MSRIEHSGPGIGQLDTRYVRVSQAVSPQTIGLTGSRLTKLWVDDITVTNAITGSVTGNAATVTTNANLTGPITSVGNATSIAAQTGTGSTFVVNTSPTLVTPVLGVASATSIDFGASVLATRSLTVDTGGVFNIVLASAAGDDFTVDTDKLVVSGDTGNVGIGTEAPGQKLEVNGNILLSGSQDGDNSPSANVRLYMSNISGVTGSGVRIHMGAMNAGGGDIGPQIDALIVNNTTGSGTSAIAFRASNYLSGDVGEREVMRIVGTGNVGIGTTSPTAKLHLPACTATANTASLKITPGTVATTAVSGNIESDGTNLYWTDSGGTRRQLNN